MSARQKAAALEAKAAAATAAAAAIPSVSVAPRVSAKLPHSDSWTDEEDLALRMAVANHRMEPIDWEIVLSLVLSQQDAFAHTPEEARRRYEQFPVLHNQATACMYFTAGGRVKSSSTHDLVRGTRLSTSC